MATTITSRIPAGRSERSDLTPRRRSRSPAVAVPGRHADLQDVIAINKDPEAPIFEIAGFGIVGDLFQVVPQLLDEITTRLIVGDYP